jgi:hypothetical protein
VADRRRLLAAVAKLLKEREGRNSSTSNVMSRRTALAELCKPQENKDARIGDLG